MKKGLLIGGFKSTWLANLVMAFLLEQPMTNAHFDDTHFAGIYRDDGIIIFKQEYKVKEVETWLTSFQNAINYFARNDYLQFTAEIWTNSNKQTKHNKVTTIGETCLPFLDMELYWRNKMLQF